MIGCHLACDGCKKKPWAGQQGKRESWHMIALSCIPTPLHFASPKTNEFDLQHNLYGSKTNSTYRDSIDLMNEVDAIEGPGKP